MKLGVADGPGLIFIHLHKNALSFGDHSLGIGAGGGKTEIAVLIHRRNSDAEGIVGVVIPNELQRVTVIVGDVIGEPCTDGFSGSTA